MIKQLPAESATFRSFDETPGWGPTEEFLATLVELTYDSNRLFIYANVPKNKRPRIADLRIPRPYAAELTKTKRPATSEEMRAFFGGAVRYTGPPPVELAVVESPKTRKGRPAAKSAPVA